MNTRILLADDHQLIRESLALVLEQEIDFSVIGQAADGVAAVNMARDLSPDVAILDITMPLMNGIEATRRITSECPDVRVMLLSMHIERHFVSEALTAGASAYVLKESPLDELLQAIRTMASGETFLSPKVQEALVSSYLAGSGNTPNLKRLTPREREILQLVAEGKNTKEIAFMLHLSSKTIEGHRRQVMEKLDLYSVADLTRYAIKQGVATLS